MKYEKTREKDKEQEEISVRVGRSKAPRLACTQTYNMFICFRQRIIINSKSNPTYGLTSNTNHYALLDLSVKMSRDL